MHGAGLARYQAKGGFAMMRQKRVSNRGRRSMIARREFMLGAAAAGMLMQPRSSHAKASQPTTKVDFDVPAGACDCHTLIHADPAMIPFFAGRTYTPETALPEE